MQKTTTPYVLVSLLILTVLLVSLMNILPSAVDSPSFTGYSRLFKNGISNNISSDPCTFALLREAYRNEGYFPGGGHWLRTNGVDHFQPDVCKFRYARVPSDFISECLEQSNTSYILTTGDSTGNKYDSGLKATSLLQFERLYSEQWDVSHLKPDKEYYIRDLPESVSRLVKESIRFCSHCSSHIERALFVHENKSHQLFVEYIAATNILDDSLQIVFPSTDVGNKIMGDVWAITMQEFVFRYYMKDKHPDVFVIFLPFAHAKRNMALSRLPMEIKYYIGLLEEYLPKTTKLVFMPSYGEFERARSDTYWKNRLFEGLLAREKIDRMNHVLYEVIEDNLLKEDGRYFGFFDLIDVSKDRGNWSTDAVHMKPVWYESIMSMFWETYCNSVLLDRF